jgi:predicted permease
VGSAGLLGAGLAQVAISQAARRLGSIAPRIDEARLSPGVLGLVLAIGALAVLLFSLVPILVARGASLETVLRALALVVASATAALVQSLLGLQRVELGYRPDSVFAVRLSLPPERYPAPADLSRFTAAMSAALAAAPGVVAAGSTSSAPLSGVLLTVPVAPAIEPPADHRDWPSATYRVVSPGYLEAIGAHRRAGRGIAESDDGAAAPIAVVNRAMAERRFAKSGAIGRQLRVDDTDTGPRTVTIVGVVDDLRETELDGPVRPEVFLSMHQVHPDAASLMAATQFWVVRVRTDPTAFAPTFLRCLRAVDPSVATAEPTDLRSYVDAAIAPRRFSAALLVAFTLVSLLLTALGVYGISAYTVEQRRHEIGIRMALGATPRSIVGLVVGRSVRLTGIGTALGVLGARLAGGFLSRLMFGVSPASPVLLALVGALLRATTIVASWLPGLRAARLDALRALSAE